MGPDARPSTICAIYARRSNEAVGDQLSSLPMQEESCRAYITAHRSAGWEVGEVYIDNGWSGGNLDRPEMARLIADVEAGRVQTVVVHRIDRLSRSLADFLGLVARFERVGATIVSVTQHFVTTSSMGRLTLNILLSFAQFEREMISERLRDWFRGARERGLWVGGPRPYGYDVVDKRLVVNPDEAAVVHRVFRAYPRIGSARIIAEMLEADGILNKFGRAWTKRTIVNMLSNRLYRGDRVHDDEAIAGTHEAIVTEVEWQRAQSEIAASGRRRAAKRRAPVPGLLKRIIRGGDGRALIHVFLRRRGRLYRYYISRERYGEGSSPNARYRATDLEDAVVDCLARLSGSTPPAADGDRRRLVTTLAERIDVSPDTVTIHLVTGAVVSTSHKACIARADARGR